MLLNASLQQLPLLSSFTVAVTSCNGLRLMEPFFSHRRTACQWFVCVQKITALRRTVESRGYSVCCLATLHSSTFPPAVCLSGFPAHLATVQRSSHSPAVAMVTLSSTRRDATSGSAVVSDNGSLLVSAGGKHSPRREGADSGGVADGTNSQTTASWHRSPGAA